MSRHWPEATRVLRVSSATLLRHSGSLRRPGGVGGRRTSGGAGAGLGRPLSRAEKVERRGGQRGKTAGVRQGEWDRHRLQDYARQAPGPAGGAAWARAVAAVGGGSDDPASARAGCRSADGVRVMELRRRPTELPVWGGVPQGDGAEPGGAEQRDLPGEAEDQETGQPRARKWLYFAALRLVKQAGVAEWYQAKKDPGGREAKRAVVGVMRKLVLALYQVAVAERVLRGGQAIPGCPQPEGAERAGPSGRKTGNWAGGEDPVSGKQRPGLGPGVGPEAPGERRARVGHALGPRSVGPPLASCLRAPSGASSVVSRGRANRAVQSPMGPIRRSCRARYVRGNRLELPERLVADCVRRRSGDPEERVRRAQGQARDL